jgi:glutamine amidotransferase
MCELLGMSCNVPTDIVFSFRGFAERGGRTGKHDDGWGLCLYEGRAVHSFREPRPCASSPLAEFVRKNPVKTKVAIAHIRKRTRGRNNLANTHPFTRELWGRTWTFAHNGTVRIDRSARLSRFVPVGSTDSEWAFCMLLERLSTRFARAPRSRARLFQAIAELSRDLAARGTFNFLLSDGQALFARCHTKLAYIVRQYPFSRATLHDADVTVDFRHLTRKTDRVAVIATMPLTKNEAWTTLSPGELLMFSRGAPVARHRG